MKTIEQQPEYLNNRCVCSLTVFDYTGAITLMEEIIESVTFSGFNEAEGMQMSKEYDGTGVLRRMHKHSDVSWQSIEFNDSGEEISNDKSVVQRDPNNNIVSESNTDIDGNISETYFTYDADNRLTQVRYQENGVELDHMEAPFNNRKEFMYDDGDEFVPIDEDLSGNTVLAVRVFSDSLYYQEQAGALFIKADGDFFITSVEDCFEAELMTLLDKTPKDIRVFTEEYYDTAGKLIKKVESVGTSFITPYERRTYYPKTEETKLFRIEMDKVTGNTIEQIVRELNKGVLTKERIEYWQYSKDVTF